MATPQYWVLREAWRMSEELYKFLSNPAGVKLADEEILLDAWIKLIWAKPTGDYANPVIPADFVHPRIYMPDQGFAPDFFHVGRVTFASRRLRDALAQPKSVIQYHPIELLRGGSEIRAQDYRWMNILACHHAIDMDRSDCVVESDINHQTGETFRFITSYNRMVFRDDIPPGAELFRVAEDLTTVLASDALAERVMRAGCTGISFEDPATYHNGGPIHRYRTATGIEEEDMNRIFPETP